ncbi:MAG: hypothetical protein AAFQ80_06250 [Cyanobacteria bacterium J06621_8]
MQLDICDRSINKATFQNHYLANNQPVLVTQGAKNWTAIAQWQQDYLATKQDLIIPQFFSGASNNSSFAPVVKPCLQNSDYYKTQNYFSRSSFRNYAK